MMAKTRDLQRTTGPSSGAWWGSVVGSVLLLAGALLLAGCPKKPEVVTPAPRAAAPPPAPVAEVPKPPQFKPVFFDFNKAELRPGDRQNLDEAIRWLKANSQARIALDGYADDRGTPPYNLNLSERRAIAVRDYLVAGGINPQRITTTGSGETRAFAPGNDEAAWQLNRRVDLTVTP
ncbi:MAG: OmpA family protein [Candidatus Methylomirabilales bacterium]